MVDKTRQVDMSGIDLVVSSVMYSPGQGQPGPRAIDVNGQTPIVVAGTSATLTANNIMTGLIISTNASLTALTVDTATNIIATLNSMFSGAQVGDSIWFTVSAHGAAGATVAAGSGGSLANGTSGTVATGTQRMFHLQITNVATPAYTLNG